MAQTPEQRLTSTLRCDEVVRDREETKGRVTVEEAISEGRFILEGMGTLRCKVMLTLSFICVLQPKSENVLNAIRVPSSRTVATKSLADAAPNSAMFVAPPSVTTSTFASNLTARTRNAKSVRCIPRMKKTFGPCNEPPVKRPL